MANCLSHPLPLLNFEKCGICAARSQAHKLYPARANSDSMEDTFAGSAPAGEGARIREGEEDEQATAQMSQPLNTGGDQARMMSGSSMLSMGYSRYITGVSVPPSRDFSRELMSGNDSTLLYLLFCVPCTMFCCSNMPWESRNKRTFYPAGFMNISEWNCSGWFSTDVSAVCCSTIACCITQWGIGGHS